jgi:hypothetical protein
MPLKRDSISHGLPRLFRPMPCRLQAHPCKTQAKWAELYVHICEPHIDAPKMPPTSLFQRVLELPCIVSALLAKVANCHALHQVPPRLRITRPPIRCHYTSRPSELKHTGRSKSFKSLVQASSEDRVGVHAKGKIGASRKFPRCLQSS